jgi:hypothetical protein
MPRLVPVTRTVLPVMLTMMTISFACHAVVQAGRAGVARFGQVAVSSAGRFVLGGFRCLERREVTVGEGGGCRAAEKKGGCRREREQGDRSADPQGPVEAAGERDVCGLAPGEEGAEVGGGDRRAAIAIITAKVLAKANSVNLG